MVSHPGDYYWSSYCFNTGAKNNRILVNHPVYKRLASDLVKKQYFYRELFVNDLDESELHVIREVLNQELVLGRKILRIKLNR